VRGAGTAAPPALSAHGPRVSARVPLCAGIGRGAGLYRLAARCGPRVRTPPPHPFVLIGHAASFTPY